MDVLTAPTVQSVDIGAPQFTTLKLKNLECGWYIPRFIYKFVSRRTYKIVLDIAALRLAEQHIGKDMASSANWLALSSAELSTIAWAGIRPAWYQRKPKLQTVQEWLTVVSHAPLWTMLFDQCFPGYRDQVQKAREEVLRSQEDPKKAESQSV